ncbi:MAG: hypothetical protein H6712_10925 [Myxococcales bacterium]|nr:hypothetical protein [Myxococcales bacterium]
MRRTLSIVPRPVHARRARPLVAGLGLATLAACAPQVAELELPGSLCHDAEGFEIPCDSELDRWLESIPDEPSPEGDESPLAEDETIEIIEIDDVETLGMLELPGGEALGLDPVPGRGCRRRGAAAQGP